MLNICGLIVELYNTLYMISQAYNNKLHMSKSYVLMQSLIKLDPSLRKITQLNDVNEVYVCLSQ